jgi:retron-type reverse transcriptase
MSTDISRIAELAKEDPKRQFVSIAHLITSEKLYEAFRNLRKDASAGIDGVTYEQYETCAEENIRQLHQRLKEGKYRAQPLRRVYIVKVRPSPPSQSMTSVLKYRYERSTGSIHKAEADFGRG